MNLETDKRFYIDFTSIRYIYPCSIKRYVEDFGVLEQYKDKKYTLKEINQIVAELIVKRPYVSGSMSLYINVMGVGYHHMLDIKNYEYEKQERGDTPIILFAE